MCIGIPMRVDAVDQFTARCSARGSEREVSLLMLQDEGLQVGDYVMIHLGYAIQKVTPEEAAITWGLLDEVLGEPGNGQA